MADRVGTVVPGTAKIANGVGTATIRLSRSDLGETILRDLQDGHRLQISVGYSVHQVERTEGDGDQLPVVKVTSWEPYELSAVPVPADAGAHTRQFSKEAAVPEIVETEEPAAPAPERRPFGAREKRALVERAGLGDDFYREHSRLGEAAFREAVFEAIVEEEEKAPSRPFLGDHRSFDDPANFRQAASQALLARIKGEQPEGAAAGVFADGEAAFGRRILENAGINARGWSDSRVLRAYATTADFALIANTVANTRVVETYTESLSSLSAVFGRRSVPDFNTHVEAMVDWTTLAVDKVNEHGEYKSSFVDESGETISVYTVGGITGVSRQLAINAAGALDDMATNQGRRLAAYVNDKYAEHLQQNSLGGPKMRDGTALFHASRGTIESL